MALWRCVLCDADIEFGDRHCPLCHETTPRDAEHTCRVIDKLLEDAKPKPVLSFARSPWPGRSYQAHEIPKE